MTIAKTGNNRRKWRAGANVPKAKTSLFGSAAVKTIRNPLNRPCICGSGKKLKHCCGKKASA